MKIINREEFFKLPNGCLYAKYTPSMWGDLSIRDDVIRYEDGEGFDFVHHGLIDIESESGEDWCDMIEIAEKEHVKLDGEATARDASYEKDQLFVVFNDADIKLLMKMLKGALGKVK